MYHEHISRKTLLFLCRTTVGQNISSLCKVTRNFKVWLPITKFIFCCSSTGGIFLFSSAKDDYMATLVHFNTMRNTGWKAHAQCSPETKHAAERLGQPATPQVPLEKIVTETRSCTTPKGLEWSVWLTGFQSIQPVWFFRFPLKS